MNLLFFASDYKIGLSSLLTDQACALNKTNINIFCIAGENQQEKTLLKQIHQNKIEIYRIKGLDQHQKFKKLTNEIIAIIKKKQINIVHVQNNWQLAIISYIKYRLIFSHKIQIIYTVHGFRHNSPIKSIFAQIIIGIAMFLFTDKIICMSQYLKNKFRLLSYKIKLIPLGVSDIFFLNSKIAPIPSKGLQMVFPAQFRKGKNQYIIIKAFAKFINQVDDNQSKLILPGTGELLYKMKKLAFSLGIQERIEFPGKCSREEINMIYKQCNIGIVSSNSETFGQSIVEPFVLGRCIISTPVGIAPDIIKEGKNGFIFRNEQELVNLLIYIHKNYYLLQTIGENNFKQRNIFSWKTIAEQYINSIYTNKNA